MKRHIRFIVSLGLGSAVFFALWPTSLSLELWLLLSVDVFYICFLTLMIRMAATSSPHDLRRNAEGDDEGLPVILSLAGVVLTISLVAIVLALNGPSGGGIGKRALALVSVPLGWLTIQTLISFHYARMYYRPRQGAAVKQLVFPGTEEPGPWDFMYFTFVLAMCAQVSDVTTNSGSMRRIVLVHSVGSFFYNAVILALVVAAITADL